MVATPGIIAPTMWPAAPVVCEGPRVSAVRRLRPSGDSVMGEADNARGATEVIRKESDYAFPILFVLSHLTLYQATRTADNARASRALSLCI